MILNMAWDRC